MYLLVLFASNNRNNFHVSLFCFDLATPMSIVKFSTGVDFVCESFATEIFARFSLVEFDSEKCVNLEQSDICEILID